MNNENSPVTICDSVSNALSSSPELINQNNSHGVTPEEPLNLILPGIKNDPNNIIEYTAEQCEQEQSRTVSDSSSSSGSGYSENQISPDSDFPGSTSPDQYHSTTNEIQGHQVQMVPNYDFLEQYNQHVYQQYYQYYQQPYTQTF